MEKIKIFNKTIFILVAFLFLAITQVKSTDYFFNGVGSYTDVSLWSPSYPTGFISASDNVTIMPGSECTLPVGTLLQISGTFTNNAEMIMNNNFGCLPSGTLINNGFILSNSILDNLGNLTNNGDFISNHNFSSQGSGTFTNSSTGIITINTIMIVFGSMIILDGTVKGVGDVIAADYPNNGTISPGFSPGILNFTSGLDLGSGGTLEIEIDGYAGAGVTGGHDQIQVSNGNGLSIHGTLSVNLGSGFTPMVGDQWVIATGNTSGAFSSLNLPSAYNWLVDITPNSIILEIVDAVLPIDLAHFKAQKIEKEVQLDWSTLVETNNRGWTIQHSENSSNWNNLSFVEGAGNSNKTNTYHYLHQTPSTENNYYRLIQEDFNGEKSHSEIRYIPIDFNKKDILVYPNPSTAWIHFNEYIEFAKIKDMNGQQIAKIKISGFQVNLINIPKGVHLIELHTKQKVYTQKLVLN